MVKQAVTKVIKVKESATINNARGMFITFEGIEGAGKTTNIAYIAEQIKNHGHEVLLTREPGGTKIGENIRDILISKEYPQMHHDTELLLMFAARSEHLHKKIIPALNDGIWVLCDRFTDASFAYQGAGRGIDTSKIECLENLVQGAIRPDVTFLFDLEAEVGLARAKNRGEVDRFEQEDIDFFSRIRTEYLKLSKNNEQRFKVIQAGHELEVVQQQIKVLIDDILR